MSRCPRSAIFDCEFLVRRLRRGERVFDRRELLAQRRDLLVEHVDLSQRLRRYLFLLIERQGRRRGLATGGVGVDRAPRRGVLEALLRPLGRVERGGESGYLAFVDAFLAALERQQIGQFLDLPIELGERLVLARNFSRQEELRQHEHRKQKNDHQQHR